MNKIFDQMLETMSSLETSIPKERVRRNAFRLTFIYFTLFIIIVFLSGSFKAGIPTPPATEMAPYATAWATEIAREDPGHPVVFAVAEATEPPPNIEQPACPQGGLVPHPCREPDNLRIVRISRYDPSLGGVNCFQWDYKYSTCRSAMANGDRWEDQFEKAAACSPEWPFGTIFEIGDHRWVCKDRGGKIVQSPAGVYWVDLLSKNAGAYGLAFGDVITVSVWWPE